MRLTRIRAAELLSDFAECRQGLVVPGVLEVPALPEAPEGPAGPAGPAAPEAPEAPGEPAGPGGPGRLLEPGTTTVVFCGAGFVGVGATTTGVGVASSPWPQPASPTARPPRTRLRLIACAQRPACVLSLNALFKKLMRCSSCMAVFGMLNISRTECFFIPDLPARQTPNVAVSAACATLARGTCSARKPCRKRFFAAPEIRLARA